MLMAPRPMFLTRMVMGRSLRLTVKKRNREQRKATRPGQEARAKYHLIIGDWQPPR